MDESKVTYAQSWSSSDDVELLLKIFLCEVNVANEVLFH